MSLLPGLNPRDEQVIKGKDLYSDERGVIANYYLPESINLVGTITSKAGSMRANHYHPVQEQKVILLSGKYISVYKDLLFENSPIKSHVVRPGDMVITPPFLAHTMIFLEDSVFVNLVNGNRDHDKFGQHTIKYDLVSISDQQKFIQKHSGE